MINRLISLDQAVDTCWDDQKVFMKVLRYDNPDPGEYVVGESNLKLVMLRP